jgi:anti-sigma regulatory factor (Ser/Thr protein kinase)
MEKKFKRDLRSLDKVFDFIDNFTAKQRIDHTVKDAVYLAVDELFTNMVRYHPKNRNDISLSLKKERNRMIIRLIDRDVEPFDLTKRKDPNIQASLKERSPGGLGIYLTKNIVDDIQYEYRNRRSIITLTKNLGRKNV